jgi:hypothetical protein
MMRRAFTALCHFRSVIPPLAKGDEGGFSASIPRHARQWLSGIDLGFVSDGSPLPTCGDDEKKSFMPDIGNRPTYKTG